MQTLNIALVEGVNVEQSPGKLMSASRPMNVASMRATSLHTSGLRAASNRRATDTQKENNKSALGTETRMSVDQRSCLSSSISMESSTHLSYTDSQEPGEDSQLNAFAMVDKLVNLNATLMWQKPELSIAAEQSCMKALPSNKGLQSLARNADMKNLQDKMGIYDWIDSQVDENGDLQQALKGQQKQLEACMPTESRKVRQGMVSDLPGSNVLVMAEESASVEQRDTESNLCHTKGGSTYFEYQPFHSMQKLEVSVVVSNELHDADASYGKGEVEIMDIGANTQIALEAIDILRCGNSGSAPRIEKATSALFDIGNDTQTAIDAIDMLNNESAPHNGKATSSMFDIGNDTQSAVDAINIMRHGTKTDMALSKVKAMSSSFGISNGMQAAIDAIDIMRHDIGNDTQIAIEAMDIMRHGIETDKVLSKVERREEIKRGSRVQNSQGDAKKHARGEKNIVSKNVSSRGVSKTLKSRRAALLNPAGPVYNSNKRFLLDFSSTMVPRRKRSRLCSPRGSLNENIQVFGWQNLHKPLTTADKQAQPDNPARCESLKSAPWLERNGDSSEVAVLTESTNAEIVRRTKKEMSTKSDCYISLEQGRKRRKCESRCIFVLFSHSLSDSIIKKQRKMLTRLGGHVTTSAAKATHFVADTFVRSRNMLEIMAAGKLVITTMWLEGCSQAEYFVDGNSYILQDVQKEKQWGFCMRSSLAASRRKPLFQGMKVVVSPTTAPDFEAIKAIIESAGGQALQKLPRSSHFKADEIASVSFVVGSKEDYDFCVDYLKKGCKVYSTELILHGVVTQNLDRSRHHLFEDYVR